MTDFHKWQQAMRLSDPEAARALGISIQAVRNYRRGHRPDQRTPVTPPEYVQNRCARILLGDSA